MSYLILDRLNPHFFNVKSYPKKIIKSIPYSHPVYDMNSVTSQNQWSEISGADRIHYCGAYWGNGFHEDGVRTAVRVIEKLGIAV